MKITIDKCADCPFFSKTLLSILGSLGDANKANAGQCNAPAASHAPAVSEAVARTQLKPPIADNRELPNWCPLRLGDLVLTIGNRGTA